ncbi:MAG: class I SAM-dependent methyltransferase [Caldilinea sp.]|nr:class I SAM-dependent methyltransferase [Caldilinea sp.]MCB0040161.1 class I SAM-dependent methyltransferase [Caldilinea sp.]MCB0150386.1 class I SAM-dependent methyltransferase [Caldilineaceae bacterium]MCO5209232.1 class I SAM-dependent methyltransferase [Caldilinea sp.]MCW5841854.1 class I SAM-dependent methyltransferase [Caldilinea sp.]
MSFLQRFTNYDVYERHTVVRDLLNGVLGEGSGATVLDVGGRRGLLAAYVPYVVTAVNPDGTGDETVDGTVLPYAPRSFDAVVTIDTLEHVPPAQRPAFMRMCYDVARRVLVIAAPFGSIEHMARERELNAQYAAVFGAPHPYLAEHVANGLPTIDDLHAAVADLQPAAWRLAFAGDYRWQADAFERAMAAAHRSRWQAAALNLYNQAISSALFHDVALRDTPDATANRFYLVFEKRR